MYIKMFYKYCKKLSYKKQLFEFQYHITLSPPNLKIANSNLLLLYLFGQELIHPVIGSLTLLF